MKQLLRKMSSAELQELVDLIAGCTCSNVTNKSENEEATGENLVQSDIKDYFDIVIFNFETLNKSVKEYKESIKDYILEKEQEFSETFAELSALREKESKGYGVEKNTIDKLNKQVNDLAKIIKDKSAGTSKTTPGASGGGIPTPSGTPKPPTPPKPTPSGTPKPPIPPKPTPSGKPGTPSTAGKITTGAGVLTAAGVFVTSKFNPARTIDGVTRPHEGADLRARSPKPLYSIKSGKVIFAGKMKGYGNYVLIEHDDVRSAYAHLSEMKVKVGQNVSQGQLIGLSGKTGTKDAHLHFEIRKKDRGDGVGGKPGMGTPINPENYFKENPDVHSPLVNEPTPIANKSTTKPQNNLIEAIAKTIRTKESGTPQGDYTIENKQGSSGSGAYQFLDGTWQALTRSYGIGTKYDRAKDAPREIQDAVAYKRIEEILKLSGGDVSKVPVAWYTGNIKGKSKDVAPEVVTAYQKEWMGILGSNMPVKRGTTAAADNSSTKLGKQEKTRTVILPVILGYK